MVTACTLDWLWVLGLAVMMVGMVVVMVVTVKITVVMLVRMEEVVLVLVVEGWGRWWCCWQ